MIVREIRAYQIEAMPEEYDFQVYALQRLRNQLNQQSKRTPQEQHQYDCVSQMLDMMENPIPYGEKR